VAVDAGVLVGLHGAFLAIFVQRFAFALAGFFAGGYLALAVLPATNGSPTTEAIVLLSGLVGAVIAWLAMDWALIVLSSLVGAAEVTTAVQHLGDVEPAWRAGIFVILAVLGIVFQSRVMKLQATAKNSSNSRRP
jgi:hypothetical protein